MNINRNHGLDTLRSIAIILVFMFHCFSFSHQLILGTIGRVGWAGVDLFFVLSGYLIGNQIFSAFVNQHRFSLKTFYFRRFLRTLPNYLFVLGLYFLIPIFREQPLITPLWKFLTFTQNFNLSLGAFSHAWSLCLEEQFYLFLPLIALFIAYKGNIRAGWLLVGFTLLAGIILRSFLWFAYIQHAGDDKFQVYMTTIYYPPFCRLDGLILGVALAMLRNFHQEIWIRMTNKSNWLMIMGLVGCFFTLYPLDHLFGFVSTTFGYLLRSASFAALTLAALSTDNLLCKTKIPGAMTLATWSYAIYLIHKQLIHITQLVLSHWNIGASSILTISMEILITFMGGWLLYTCIETPFLKLRNKLEKNNAVKPILQSDINQKSGLLA